MTKEEKNQLIDVLEKSIKENNNFYLADISGLTAEESSALRRLCFKREVSLQVVKNTLLKNLDKLILSQKFKFLLSNKYLSRRDCIMLPYQALKKVI